MYGYNPYYAPNSRANTTYQQQFLNGRIVMGLDEARVAQIPLDGSISYFPSPAENKIYTKGIDMNGMPVFNVYRLEQQTDQGTTLMARVEALENQLKEMLTNAEPDAKIPDVAE